MKTSCLACDPDTEEPVPSTYLYPGQMFVSARPAKVLTILGSCVAVCLWDAKARVGGINHFLLPSAPAKLADLRYGNTALPKLLDAMQRQGATPDGLTAKIFGGATVLEGFSGSRLSIGDQNVDVARVFLARNDIAVVASECGGRHGRKLVFHTGNGCVSVKGIGS